MCVRGRMWPCTGEQTVEMEKRQQTMERNDNNPQLLLEELNEIEQRLLQISADQVSSSFYHAACVLCVCCWCQSSSCAIVCRTMRLTVCCASPHILCVSTSTITPGLTRDCVAVPRFPFLIPPELCAQKAGSTVRNLSDTSIYIARNATCLLLRCSRTPEESRWRGRGQVVRG